MSELVAQDFKNSRNILQDVACEQENTADIPLALANSMGRTPLPFAYKKAALGIIRDWANYANAHNVPPDNIFAIRYHVPRFAALAFGQSSAHEPLEGVGVKEIRHQELEYTTAISTKTSKDILSDPDVAVIGGAARLALKMYAQVDSANELPISDIDAVFSSKAKNIAARAKKYNVDLSGAKIIDGEIENRLGELVTNFDCTMNQVAVHKNKLKYSAAALQDIREGNIRLIAKNDPLFGSEGVKLPDGNVYIHRNGFYRGLAFLLRGKGENLIVSKENIEREKDAIGRYWQVLLFVKLLPIQNETARYNAIGHWHDIAKRIGSTETESPIDFMSDLMKTYPETSARRSVTNDNAAQARWIIGKLIARSIEQLHAKEEFVPPATYTEANLSLSPSFPDYNYKNFMSIISNLKNK